MRDFFIDLLLGLAKVLFVLGLVSIVLVMGAVGLLLLPIYIMYIIVEWVIKKL